MLLQIPCSSINSPIPITGASALANALPRTISTNGLTPTTLTPLTPTRPKPPNPPELAMTSGRRSKRRHIVTLHHNCMPCSRKLALPQELSRSCEIRQWKQLASVLDKAEMVSNQWALFVN